MNGKKSFLQEIALGADAVKTARSEPIQQQEQPRQTMDFLRSLVLDIPQQQYVEKSVDESMNIEKMLETQLEAEARKLEAPADPKDQITFDIPLLIRVFELVREGMHSDVEVHQLVERLIALRDKGTLTMDDYEAIAGGNLNGEKVDSVTSSPLASDTTESLDFLKKLAGIR